MVPKRKGVQKSEPSEIAADDKAQQGLAALFEGGTSIDVETFEWSPRPMNELERQLAEELTRAIEAVERHTGFRRDTSAPAKVYLEPLVDLRANTNVLLNVVYVNTELIHLWENDSDWRYHTLLHEAAHLVSPDRGERWAEMTARDIMERQRDAVFDPLEVISCPECGLELLLDEGLMPDYCHRCYYEFLSPATD